jgi:condensin complex subunit 1
MAQAEEASTEKATAEEEQQADKSKEQTPQVDDEDTEMTEADADTDKEEQYKENQPEEVAPTSEAAALEIEQHQAAKSIATPAQKIIVSPEKLQQLVMMRTFHGDAVRFIEQIHAAIPTITQLLSSKSKAEVLESMDFLVVGYNYKVKPSAVKFINN